MKKVILLILLFASFVYGGSELTLKDGSTIKGARVLGYVITDEPFGNKSADLKELEGYLKIRVVHESGVKWVLCGDITAVKPELAGFVKEIKEAKAIDEKQQAKVGKAQTATSRKRETNVKLQKTLKISKDAIVKQVTAKKIKTQFGITHVSVKCEVFGGMKDGEYAVKYIFLDAEGFEISFDVQLQVKVPAGKTKSVTKLCLVDPVIWSKTKKISAEITRMN